MNLSLIKAEQWEEHAARWPAASSFLIRCSLRAELAVLRRAQERHSENALHGDWTATRAARWAELEAWAAEDARLAGLAEQGS